MRTRVRSFAPLALIFLVGRCALEDPTGVGETGAVEGVSIRPSFASTLGSQLASVLPNPSTPHGRAIAHDPATGDLYYTLATRLPDGTVPMIRKIFVTDRSGAHRREFVTPIGFTALSWDAKRGVLWGGTGSLTSPTVGQVFQITPQGGASLQFEFSPIGGNCSGGDEERRVLLDGLAYDEGPTSADDDDRLWISDQAGDHVHEVDLKGHLLRSFTAPQNPSSGMPSCNTGIAVGGDFLWLALLSANRTPPYVIVRVSKADPRTVLSSFLFSTALPVPFDLELDATTFGRCALWSNEFGFFVSWLRAWALEEGVCAPANVPPSANAGPDRTAECASHQGCTVALDGSGSSDPDGTIAQYEWLKDGEPIAMGVSATAVFSLGTHTVTLRVTDADGASAEDQVVITIIDTAPPEVALSVTPAQLWPPNHKDVSIAVTVSASDLCDPSLVIAGSVISSEGDDEAAAGEDVTVGDIRVIKPDGTVLTSSNASPEVSFNPTNDRLELRAERYGDRGERRYTITLTATDGSGNSATASAMVIVPHSPEKTPGRASTPSATARPIVPARP